MSEFSTDELFDTIDTAVRDLIVHAGITAAPVETLAIAQRVFGYVVEYIEDDDGDGEPRRRPRGRVLQLRHSATEENRNLAAARAIARELIPNILSKLGVVGGTEHKSAQNQMIGLIAPRLLLPKRWFEVAARKASGDILRIKETFTNVSPEIIAMRLLDLEDPCVIAVVDDNVVVTRRSNCTNVNKTLTEAEQRCVDTVTELEEPAAVRREGWSAWAWPILGSQFRRILVRAVPDDL